MCLGMAGQMYIDREDLLMSNSDCQCLLAVFVELQSGGWLARFETVAVGESWVCLDLSLESRAKTLQGGKLGVGEQVNEPRE